MGIEGVDGTLLLEDGAAQFLAGMIAAFRLKDPGLFR